MEAYYEESQGLDQVPLDSIRRFSAKVDEWVNTHPDASHDAFYPEIQQKIHLAMVKFSIEIEDSWDGDIYIHFGFNENDSKELTGDSWEFFNHRLNWLDKIYGNN